METSGSSRLSTPTTPAEKRATAWLIGVIAVQLVCQGCLMVEQFATMRVVFRTAAFLASLGCLVLAHGRSVRHPSFSIGVAALVIVGLNVLHPTSNSLLSSLAHVALYVAIMAPLFWVPRLAVTPRVLARLIAALWMWYTLSASVGVLQVYFPGYFDAAVATNVREMGVMAEGLKVTLADGTRVWRPMGLTDAPGGAAMAGLFAFLFGLGYFVNSDRGWVRVAGLGGMMVGLFCIYLCQIRSVLVMCGISAVVFAVVVTVAGRLARAARLLVAVPAVALGSFVWATATGGQGVSDRFETLLAGDPTAVYQKNRGMFLDETLDVLLPRYPAGAGLGRWGMVVGYFGDRYNLDAQPIYVEIQLTGWLLDGGVPLIMAYGGAILVACWAAGRVALRSRDPWLGGFAAVVLAYDVGAVAVTFNYPLFIGQGGLEFWLLNAAVVTAAALDRPRADSERARHRS